MKQYDTGDEAQVKERKTERQLERERCDEELRQILSTKGGRYFLWRFLSQTKLFETISSHDPHMMAIWSGFRDMGVWLYNEINRVDTNAVSIMAEEAKTRKAI